MPSADIMNLDRFRKEQLYRIYMDKGLSVSGLSSFFHAAQCSNLEISLHIDSVIMFMLCQDYHHPGLPPMIYINHPFRVASILLTKFGVHDEATICLALLHNILELVPHENIIEVLDARFPELVPDLTLLQVDRARQLDPSYITSYYNQISCSKRASLVKTADKFDNIFMIPFNKSDIKRQTYIQEFRYHINVLVESYLPSMAPLIQSLASIASSIGYLDKESFSNLG